MKVPFCVLLLELCLSVIHASTTDNTPENETFTTTFSSTVITGFSDRVSPRVENERKNTNQCYDLNPPVPQNSTNSSVAVILPEISWSLNISHESCGNITLLVSCKNVENNTDSSTIGYNISNMTEVSTQLKLKERTTYRCYGKLKSSASLVESGESDTIVVTTTIIAKINITNINNTAKNIFIEWVEISNGTKLTYNVEITEMNAVHFSPDCKKRNSSISVPNIEKTFYNFTTALPDHNYSIVVSTTIRSSTIGSDVRYVTTPPAAPDKPKNVLVKDSPNEDNSSPNISKVVTWDIPCHPNGQIQRFEIDLIGIHSPDQTRHQPQTVITVVVPKQEHFEQILDGLWASTNYTLIIRAVGENGEAGPGFETNFGTRDAKIKAATPTSLDGKHEINLRARTSLGSPLPCNLNPPVPQNSTNSSVAVVLPEISWSLNISHESCGNNITLLVSCKNIENNTDSSAIGYDIGNMTEVSTQLKLKERTTFRCYGKIKSSDPLEESVESDTIVVTTIIRDRINITNINNSTKNIFIEWAEISNETKLTYDVEITEMNAVHFSPNCEKINSSISVTHIEKTFYNFTAALPDHNYSIVISTTIRSSTIRSDVRYVTTPPAAPDKPRNVLVKDPSNEDNGSPNISKIVTWDIPCHPNGQIQRFEIDLTGIYTPDQTRHQPQTVITVVLPNKQEHFEQTLDGLWASTNYTLIIRAVGENGEAGPGFETNFGTRDAIPVAPLVSITPNSSPYLEIQWQLSDEIRYGKIIYYNLNISPVGPAYGLYPSDCPVQNSFHVQLDGAITSYNYTNASSYWIYGISVNASTSRGTGPNGNRTVTTVASAPDKPRNVLLDDPVDSNKSQNVQKLIRWDVPCFANDRITSYLVQLNGSHTLIQSYNDIRQIAFNVTPDQKQFSEILDNLHPSTEYLFSIRARGENEDKGTPVFYNFTTREAIPDAPVVNENQFNITNCSVSFMADFPNEKAGKIILYKIIVTEVAPLFFIPDDCFVYPSEPINDTIKERFYNFSTLPYHKYKIEVAAATQIGSGDFTTVYVNTSAGVPETVRALSFFQSEVQEEYDAKAFIKFKRPCFSNGPLTNITINYKGSRTSFKNISHEEPIKFSNETNLEHSFGLKPEYFYEVTITTDNGDFSNSYEFDIFASSGVPPMISQNALEFSGIRPTGIDVRLGMEHLNNTNGEIKYISLILSKTAQVGKFAEWDGTNWPVVFDEGEYQLTTDFWAPSKDADVAFSIGSDSPGCNKSKKFCNEPLKEDTQYFVIVRMFTQRFLRDNPSIPFRTGKSWTGFIYGMIFGLLMAGVLAIIAFFLWRKGVFKIIMDRIPKKTPVAPALSKGIPCNKFLQYCKNMECNPQKYHEQYALLTEKAKEMTADKTICIATLSENRRKNRYTNIAPYDQTRVELRIDEDDEIGSDYINASFIKGYSGNVEYIATQGPMATTTRDFWKMVLQENVTMIVMVSQFVENGKEKCHRYFPKNHESMIISDDMEVRCSIELHFGTYCMRNLQVRKDDVQATVTHMQFLDWPDFGVPVGTDNLLQFCYQLRERNKMEGGLIIVHCSAGVGRTGTLIATDILLQTANAGKPIDVFNTVLELRKQRVMMVQTDKQYIFIHNMLKEHLDRPPTPDPLENSEPMYENMEIIKHSRNSEIFMNKKEDESEF